MRSLEGVAMLVPIEFAGRMAKLVAASAPHTRTKHVLDVEQLELLSKTVGSLDRWLLLSHSNSCIVPEALLSRFWLALNFHAAPPEYPGRDPHHFAAYDEVRSYGATAHVMTKEVDAGPIVAVKRFPVNDQADPMDLLHWANEACWALIEELIPSVMKGEEPQPLQIFWGKRKRTRKEYLALCELSCSMEAAEVARRVRATQLGDRSNAYISLHNYRFRYEPERKENRDEGVDFTIASYISLLEIASQTYKFAVYGERVEGPHVLWRHDIDLSVHRALRLARLEHEKRLRATYFFMLRSSFYNLLEADVLARARQIVALGHQAGLHLSVESADSVDIANQATVERDLLSRLLGTEISVVSFHNPTTVDSTVLESSKVAGMVNAYSPVLTRQYVYCSDSNGYWRHRSLRDLLTIDKPARLHVLTHPEWWTEESMAPRERVELAVAGRAAAVMRAYDALLALHGRKNGR